MIIMKKNNIHFKTIKMKLVKLLNNRDHLQIINKFSYKMNDLIILSYLFINAFIMHNINNSLPKISIDKDFLDAVYKCLTVSDNRGKPITSPKKLKIIKLLDSYHKRIFSKIKNVKKIKVVNMSYLIGSTREEMFDSIINNILFNYHKCIKSFVYCKHRKTIDLTIKNLQGDDKICRYPALGNPEGY